MAAILVENESTLLQFLLDNFSASQGQSRTALKKKLAKGVVTVDGVVQTSFAYPLKPGNVVDVLKVGVLGQKNPFGIRVLFEDNDLVAINKPAGLLTVSTENEKAKTAFHLTRELLNLSHLYMIHRLDRETSGVLLFAKTLGSRAYFLSHWKSVRKFYLTIVEGCPHPEQGVIELPLTEDQKSLDVFVDKSPPGVAAKSRYRVLRKIKMGKRLRSLCEVEIMTGRKHQIRVHMLSLGCPVVGDQRYGQKDKRLALHAKRICFAHPLDGKSMTIECACPEDFIRVAPKCLEPMPGEHR